MAKEIERKFLVRDDSFIKTSFKHIDIIQGYLSTNPDSTVRIRITGENAFLTIKTRNIGATRNEWEIPVSLENALEIISEASIKVISKTRYFCNGPDGNIWEIDKFHNKLEGLVVAEIELTSEDSKFVIPPFIGKEVTGNPEYYNSNLAEQA